ncbi:MAG: PKD domain-containing protein [Bacteroidia bacterium]|nr:PKD domain-containing protein [Bacteroidia bacterium]
MMKILCRIGCCLILFIPHLTSGQCPVPAFTASSPVCAGQAITLNNSSTGASNYQWDFCPGFFSTNAVLASDTVLNSLSYPGDIVFHEENDTLIGFICGKGNSKLYRTIFGNGPGQVLTSLEDLGSFGNILYNPSDMALYQEGGTWFGLIVDYGSNSLIRLRFGSSLRNIPDSATTLLNNTNSNLTTPWSIRLVRENGGTIYGIIGNFTAGTITVMNFGNSIRNTPVPSVPIAVAGVSTLLDLEIAKSCDHYFAIIAGYTSGNIVSADFGSSFGNTPVFTTLLTAGSPSDIALVQDSSHWKLLYTNYSSHDIRRYDLGQDLTGTSTPVYLGSDHFSGSNPKGISLYRKEGSMYAFVLFTGSNNLQVLDFSHACPASISSSTDVAPTGVLFPNGGDFPIVLMAEDTAGNFASTVQSIQVSYAPTVDFTVSGTCFGDMTQFTDSSSMNGGTITSWLWDFGDGGSSGLPSPSYQYTDTGNFTVTLTTNGSTGCNSSISKTIRIAPVPVADFSAPPGCSDAITQFTDLSSVSSGTIDGWNWTFGNGDTSNVQSPSYVYPGGGNYLVTLTVVTDGGCSDSHSLNLLVNDKPEGAFEASNTCVGQSVQFIDLTTVNGASITDYLWNFGDGNTDVTSNPSHTYSGGVNNYSLQFIVTASNGCMDTVNQVIRINNIPTANFSVTPGTICQGNTVTFSDLSGVAGDTISAWFWDFGDGTFDSVPNPIHSFSTAGNNVVRLIVYSPSSCPSPLYTQSVLVEESPVAGFTSTQVCLGSNTQFTDQSTAPAGGSITGYQWNFTTGDSSIMQNPSYSFSNPGVFQVELTVTSNLGCTNTSIQPVNVYTPPVAAFTFDNPCSGQAVQFTNESFTDSISTLTAFTWNFGDFTSPSNTSILENPNHIYSGSQTYYAFLIATTNFGCSDTTLDTLEIHPSAPAQFTYSPTCYGDLMEFFNPGSGLDSSYNWNFGDNQSNQLQNPAHFYAFPGTYNVTLTVYSFSGCATTASRLVTVSPIPVANFRVTPACTGTPYTLTDSSSVSSGSITQWHWNITGMPDPDSVQNPVYLFQDTGTYQVSLTVRSDIGCEKSLTKNIHVYPLPEANFSFNPQFGNPPLDVQFTDYSTGGSAWQWDFGDGSSMETIHEPSHIYQDTGLFSIHQYVTSSYGCRDSADKNIYVIRPVLDVAVTGDSSYLDGNYFYIVARIANLGTREIDSLNISARLEDGTTIREKYLTPLPNGPSGIQSYSFRAAFLISPDSKFDYYCIRVSDPNGEPDSNPANDEKCFDRKSSIAVVNPYPNPFSRQVVIRLVLPFEDRLSISLYDIYGNFIRSIFTGSASRGLFERKCDLGDLPDGTYALRVDFRDEVILRKVVKQEVKK